jgi:two-component system response regulator RegX3
VSSRILVVDDEPSIAESVSYALRQDGFEVDAVGDGGNALVAAREQNYDLMILDLLLPGVSGLDVCRSIRAESDIPIIMLTARDAEVDRVVGLEIGADDYVTKPFSVAELVSRVRAHLRRRALDRNAASTTVTLGTMRLDFASHLVEIDGKPVHLTPSEFRVLGFLARAGGRACTRRELMQHLWQSDYIGDEHACDVHISNLRRKIERDPTRPERLLTIRGVGYRLAPV